MSLLSRLTERETEAGTIPAVCLRPLPLADGLIPNGNFKNRFAQRYQIGRGGHDLTVLQAPIARSQACSAICAGESPSDGKAFRPVKYFTVR